MWSDEPPSITSDEISGVWAGSLTTSIRVTDKALTLYLYDFTQPFPYGAPYAGNLFQIYLCKRWGHSSASPCSSGFCMRGVCGG